MPIFTAAAAAIVGTTALTGIGATIATSVIAAGLAAGTGHLLGVFDTGAEGPAYSDPGVDQRSRANTQNKLPVLYGSFMTRGLEMYQSVTADRTGLWTVIALGEGSVSSIDRIFWDDLELTLDSRGQVTSATDRDGNTVDRLNGLIQIDTFLGEPNNNFASRLNNAFPEWTVNHRMTSITYVVVTVTYSPDNDVRSLNDMRFIGTAPVSNPAAAVRDQLQNPRYGLNLPDSALDTDSFTEIESYFDELVESRNPVGAAQMLPRYQVNGVIGTEANVMDRINTILMSCNSSLRWTNGRYSIFVNRQDPIESYFVTEDNLIGSVEVVEQGLNNLINKLVIQFGRDEANNWQPQETILETPVGFRLPNEPDRERQIRLPLTATSVEAQRVGFIILNESREQLIIQHSLDVTAMSLEAGDVIPYTLPDYGFDNKPFRITRISEIEIDGGLQYEVEAIEYANDVYAEQMYIEPGASPNTSLPSADIIGAVNDLAVGNVIQQSSTPSFTLNWTAPVDSLIRQFDIFVNPAQDAFGQANTRFLQSSLPPSGNAIFAGGEVVSATITGLVEGSYNLWVVGRNNAATSAESNTAVLNNWNPITVPIAEVTGIRHHDNPVGTDPNAPSGRDGTDVGWYDPEVGATITTNIPADPDPHWEARGFGRLLDGRNRILDFGLTGEGAVFESITTPGNQEYRFDASGTPGQRVLDIPARPEITQFDLSGAAALFSGTAGIPQIDRFDFTGTTATSSSVSGIPTVFEFDFSDQRVVDIFGTRTDGVAQVSYIYLTGNAQSTGTANQQATGLAHETQYELTATFTADDLQEFVDNNDVVEIEQVRFTIAGPGAGLFEGLAFNAGDFSAPFSDTPITTLAEIVAFTDTWEFNASQSIIGTGDTYYGNLIYEIVDSIELSDDGNSVTIRFRVFGDTEGVDGLLSTTSLGVVFTGRSSSRSFRSVTSDAIYDIRAVAAEQTAIALTASDADLLGAGTLGMTYRFPDGTNTASGFQTSLLNQLNADTLVSDMFIVEGVNASGITGVPDGEPIVRLTRRVAGEIDDLIAGFIDASGDLSGSSVGTITAGVNPTDQRTITVSWDNFDTYPVPLVGLRAPFLIRITQTVTLGNYASTEDIAETFRAASDLHWAFTATRSGNVVTLTTTSNAAASLPSSILSGNSVSGITVTRTQLGSDGVLTGTPSSYVISRAGADITTGTFGDSQTSDQVAATINTAIGSLVTTHTSTVAGSEVTVTSNENGPDRLVVTITAGTNRDGTPGSIAVTRNTVQTGEITSTDGTPSTFSISIAGAVITTGNFDSGATSEAATATLTAATDSITGYSSVQTGSQLVVTSDANTDADFVITVTPGVNEGGLPASLAITRTVTQQGAPVDTFNGSTKPSEPVNVSTGAPC